MAASSKLTNFNPANFFSPFVFTFMSLLLLWLFCFDLLLWRFSLGFLLGPFALLFLHP
jgi:hypothetical protein